MTAHVKTAHRIDVPALAARMEQALPLEATPGPELVAVMAQRLPDWPLPRSCPVVGVTYVEGAGGILCRLALSGSEAFVLMVSVTQLAFDEDTPLGREVAAYCRERDANLQAAAEKRAMRVPRAMADKFASLAADSDAVCLAHLDAEYATLTREALATLCRKRPSPVATGKPEIWAAAALYEVGHVNFLTDASRSPSMSTKRLCALFGVSEASLHAKSKLVRAILGTHRFEPRWTRGDLIDHNPYFRIAEMMAGAAVPREAAGMAD